ncbi:hypothetical protein [Patulibacter sp.]|uniref:hypothetical protein n=1 Tax=Patulibacter sp. TaxID=1912859 RepID=UPI0027164C64|nr:hypothetical protein [Patulibacter sp.]MDO9410202.1 hypothetical protein [Patulibacter sp.]
MDDRDLAHAGPLRRPEPLRARARPRAVDIDDPDSIAAPGRPSRRSTWARATIGDSRVGARTSRIVRNR